MANDGGSPWRFQCLWGEISARRGYRQHHHSPRAAEIPRAQPGRERLAVHARQLALKPRLQILRRSRRSLLRGMEQARRSTLADHDHRIARLGERVLINGTWYNSFLFVQIMKLIKSTIALLGKA